MSTQPFSYYLYHKPTGLKRSDVTKRKLSESAEKRELLRKENDWHPTESSILRGLSTRKKRIEEGLINPYSEERNNKMRESKKGTKRQYLPDGSFIMVRNQDAQ